MRGIVVGSEAIASGRLTRHHLRTRYVKLHRNVYAPAGLKLTALDRAFAAWLWSRREATLVGSSAAAALGTRWLPCDEPAELGRTRHHAPTGIVIHSDAIADDEQQIRRGMACTTPARTAYDPRPSLLSSARSDAGHSFRSRLMNATKLSVDRVRADSAMPIPPRARIMPAAAKDTRTNGRRRGVSTGNRDFPSAAHRVTGCQRPGNADTRSSKRLRQGGGAGSIWAIPNRWSVVEYDGEQHFTNPDDYANDIERLEFLADKGWNIVRVSTRQLRHERSADRRSGPDCARAGVRYLTRVNCPTLVMPRRKKSAHPVR